MMEGDESAAERMALPAERVCVREKEGEREKREKSRLVVIEI